MLTPGKFVVLMNDGQRALYGVPILLAKSAIPFIGLSSGSIAANGAISGITALPTAYAAAYCWFPANALATVKSAGWYYCTFSSTTAGTAYLDTYTSGIPLIPSTPTPVTDGRGAFSGDIGEEFGPTITVPANVMGPNGALRMALSWTQNNNANVKTGRLRYSTSGGTIVNAVNLASTGWADHIVLTSNRGATGVQVTTTIGVVAVGPSVNGVVTGVDTTLQSSLVVSMQRATATDNIVLESFLIELLSDGT